MGELARTGIAIPEDPLEELDRLIDDIIAAGKDFHLPERVFQDAPY